MRLKSPTQGGADMTKILIVDDEENIRFSFATILTDAGYDVIKVGHIIDAKSILSVNQVEVAIVDRLLMSHNGMDLVEYINKAQPFCTTILISAFPSFKSASEGFKHRLFAYLQKPIKKDELLNIVKTAAQNSKEKLKSYNNEQQLIQSQKMATMGMLACGIVHDFNNLLMTINGIAELSCLDLPAGSPLLESFEQIKKVGEQGSKFSKQLSSYIHQENGKPEYVRIQPLIKETLGLLRIAAPKVIKIQENIGKGNDTILVHPVQIQQVILNLGINAIHAMKNKNGVLKVSLEKVQLDIESMESLCMETQNCIRISMKDTGCGMDETVLKQISEPFFSTKANGVGTGIGLSITNTILKRHGGAITAESQLGKGSFFHVYLPVIEK
jgi:signal transduction histidine kinase